MVVPSVRLLQVWVGGLHPRVTEKSLRACFSVLGEVEFVKVRAPPAAPKVRTDSCEQERSHGEASARRMRHRAATLGSSVCAGEKRCPVFSETESIYSTSHKVGWWWLVGRTGLV